MTLYLYEDASTSPFMSYIRQAVTDSVSERIIPVGGGSKFIDEIGRHTGVHCAAFVDIAFDNARTFSNYNKLLPLAKAGVVLPIPVVNAEYYYLQLASAYKVPKCKDAVELCLTGAPYFDYMQEHHGISFKNYEKFCKYCVVNYLGGCTGGSYHEFMHSDCMCDRSGQDCMRCASVEEKVRLYLNKWPIRPFVSGKPRPLSDVISWVISECERINSVYEPRFPLRAIRPGYYTGWV